MRDARGGRLFPSQLHAPVRLQKSCYSSIHALPDSSTLANSVNFAIPTLPLARMIHFRTATIWSRCSTLTRLIRLPGWLLVIRALPCRPFCHSQAQSSTCAEGNPSLCLFTHVRLSASAQYSRPPIPSSSSCCLFLPSPTRFSSTLAQPQPHHHHWHCSQSVLRYLPHNHFRSITTSTPHSLSRLSSQSLSIPTLEPSIALVHSFIAIEHYLEPSDWISCKLDEPFHD